MIIGLTGTKASGKGVVADILKERGFAYYSLSDIVREEAVIRGLSNYTIAQLQDIGNELRENHGNGVLAKRVLEKIEKERDAGKQETKNYVIDGIRNPGEIDELKKSGGHEFILVAVDAPQEARFKRLLERARGSDPEDWQGFLEMERRDRGIEEENSGQQVGKCLEMTDIKLYNDLSIEVLKDKIEKILNDLKC
ncbi:MAG TPA: AAA family ATPase [Candidatus Nanoarchaeia archaeon]|nr:AAA family ATPase [Candidatus Nanoarchaeia archaeon]